MLFNSLEFFIFFPIVFVLYWMVFKSSRQAQNILILLSSYVFYGWWNINFLWLLIGSTVLDYLYGFGVNSSNRNKAKLFLWLCIINNLGILFVFKYYNFFLDQVANTAELFGHCFKPAYLSWILPIGISFYTFHGMSYIFDVYNKKQEPIKKFTDYAVFVCYFPLLVAGPIERAGHLLPQIRSNRTFNYKQAVEGCKLILWGLFKKVVIADNLAMVADAVFDHHQDHYAYALILGAIAFSFQIYCDFSGYSDIALGTSKLLGIELLTNFRFPYFSRDIAEFWRRWHISLSTWFRDYIYIPLGGSKVSRLLSVRNVYIIFLISGFWHGASWNFIIWGFLHACGFLPLLLLNRNRKNASDVVAQGKILPSLRELLQMLSTFCFVTLAWIFFRAKSIDVSIQYIVNMFKGAFRHPGQFLTHPSQLSIFVYILPLLVIDWYLRHNERKLKTPVSWFRYPVYIVLYVLVLLNMGKKASFIYFQF